NLVNMVRRFETDEVPGARVLARFAKQEREVVADGDGFFDLELELETPPPAGSVWHSVELELIAPKGGRPLDSAQPVTALGQVLVPFAPDFAVVSDLDDTVIRTSVTDFVAMARVVLLGNAHTRLPFEGVSAFYRALRGGPDGTSYNPIFYVSSGPWNLYDLIEEFLDLNDIPAGPVFLRNWGLNLLKGHGTHKLDAIRRLFAAYPTMRFVLVGDSGEKDPEIYRQVVLENPGRVLAVYIRDVAGQTRHDALTALTREVEAAGTPMLLVADTVTAAKHARNLGLLAPEAVPEVRQERAEEQAQPEVKQAAATGTPLPLREGQGEGSGRVADREQ
ncbi:MAG TPA: phosphatase domain-containing protein, partial [Deinococcales bacterium]|nr:phosphatase domain-containing protein [Deinococcales bacterium]